MFKYGTFKNFVVKFVLGTALFSFGLVYLTSLYSYSPNDPGFNQLNQNFNDNDIKNLFGFFGAYLSSYSLIFIGTLAYFLGFLILIEGGKFILGIISRMVFLKFLSNFSATTGSFQSNGPLFRTSNSVLGEKLSSYPMQAQMITWKMCPLTLYIFRHLRAPLR